MKKRAMGDKGIILMTDAIMAIIVVFLIIIAAHAEMRNAQLEYLDQRYAQELGNDVLAVLTERGVLQTLDAAAIESNITRIMPPPYSMLVSIDSYSYSGDFVLNETIEAGSEPPEEKSRVSGRGMFVSGENSTERYNLMRFVVWQQ